VDLQFLSVDDAARALRSLGKLARHDIRNWALVGGVAFETHAWRLGLATAERALNDLDFITSAFDCLPDTLSQDFLFRHIHAAAPPGKTMVQLVDTETRLRIDIFRTSTGIMDRAENGMASLEDLVSRAARLLFDLAEGKPVASKHARDYLRFIELAGAEKMETAWQDHRKPAHPGTFREAKLRLGEMIPRSASLLITPRYSQDPSELCPLCAPARAFELADANLVLSLLGYC
jgi:hypothetical protein